MRAPPRSAAVALRRQRRRARRVWRRLAFGLAALGASASLLLLLDPAVATRWLRRAPRVRLTLPDTRATPLKADPEAIVLPVEATVSLKVLGIEAPRDRLRHLLAVPGREGRPGCIVAGGVGGLTVLDLAGVKMQDGCAELPRARVQVLDTRDGLPDLRVEALALAPGHDAGAPRLWVGTRGGLAELRFKETTGPVVVRTFRVGLVSPRVSALAFDGSRLIVATHDGGLHRLEGDRLRPLRTAGRRGRSVAALLAVPASAEGPASVIFAGRRGVGRLTHGGRRVTWIGRRWISSLRRTRRGQVLAGGPDGLFRLHGNSLQPLPAMPGPVARLLGTGCDPGGCDRVLPVGLDGRALSAPARAARVDDRARLSVKVSPGAGRASRLRFAVGDAGLSFEDPAGHDHLLRLGGLQDADVSALEVVSGLLWVGTYDAGLWKIGDGRTRRLAPSILRVDALVHDGRGGVLVATPEGVFSVNADASGVVRYGVEAGLPSAHVTDLALAPDGTLWAATAGGVGEGQQVDAGEAQLGGWRFRSWTQRNGAPLTHLDAVAVLPEGRVAFGALHGLLLRGRDGIFSVLRPGAGLPDGWITAIVASADGEVTLGTYDAGLLRLVGDRVERLAVGIGTATARINPRALIVAGGRVLAGTSGGGLLLVGPAGTRAFGVRSGLPSAEVTALAASGETIWVGTRSGLARVRLVLAPVGPGPSSSPLLTEVARR